MCTFYNVIMGNFRIHNKMMMESTNINPTTSFFTFSNMSDIKNKFELKRLKRRVDNLEKIYFDDQFIEIIGCEHLRNVPGQHWKSKIYSLFHDTGLPSFYIINMFTNNITDTVPSKVVIQLITYRVKLFVRSILIDFFLTHKKENMIVNIVYDN
jgi:hypothetical protein